MSEQDIFIYAAIVIAALITYSLRVFGLALMKNVTTDGLLFSYTNYITYALISALVIKLIIAPNNQLAEVPLSWRLGVSCACVAVYLIHKKYLLLYMLSAVAALSLMQSGLQP